MAKTDPYRVFPAATNDERQLLKASIEEVGLRNPVVIDEFKNVIDGHDRRDICEELDIDWLENATVLPGLSEDEKCARAIELNLWRKSIIPSSKQKRQLIEKYWPANPKVSENRIADLFGISQPTANRIKKELIKMDKFESQLSTIGKDGVERRVGNRKKPARLMIKSANEFDSIEESLREVASDLNGVVRRPMKVVSLAKRKRALNNVENSVPISCPANIEISNCDFRDLKIQPNSVDLILTDPLWTIKAQPDWDEMARLAKLWLKDDGRLISIIGNDTLGPFIQSVSKFLLYEDQAISLFETPSMNLKRKSVDNFRSYLIFKKSDKAPNIYYSNLLHTGGMEKEYDEFQQPLAPSLRLIEDFTVGGSTILDPFCGTGTNALATSLAGQGRRFIGCDLRKKMCETAKHRVLTEGRVA